MGAAGRSRVQGRSRRVRRPVRRASGAQGPLLAPARLREAGGRGAAKRHDRERRAGDQDHVGLLPRLRPSGAPDAGLEDVVPARCRPPCCPTCGGSSGSGATTPLARRSLCGRRSRPSSGAGTPKRMCGGQGLRFSFAAVDHLKLRIDEHNAAWRAYFERCGIEPLGDSLRGARRGLRGEVLWLLDGSASPFRKTSPSRSRR